MRPQIYAFVQRLQPANTRKMTIMVPNVSPACCLSATGIPLVLLFWIGKASAFYSETSHELCEKSITAGLATTQLPAFASRGKRVVQDRDNLM